MKVILKQDVKNLGKKNTLVEVGDGYARNFLLPRNLAVEASAPAMNEMKLREQSEKNKKAKELEAAKKLSEKISKIVLKFRSKAGENGKLFGSITSKDIAEKLEKEFNISVNKRKIILPEAIKTLGAQEIEVKLHTGVSSTLIVEVIHEE